MMPAAKHFDPILGVDIHIIQPPGPVPPVPIPHPWVGFVMDPFDYAPILGSTVKINGVHRAQAGTEGKNAPKHIPIGGTFVKPPANECEMFMGSSTVCIDGDAQSYMALPALDCHCVGMPPIPRLKKKSPIASLVLPTSVVLPVPAGPPVLIGGPPTVSLMALGMKVGMAALGKAFKKLAKTKAFQRAMEGFKKARKKAFKNMKPGFLKCKVLKAEPVNITTGEVVVEQQDFSIPGRIPIEWNRNYGSHCDYNGVCGYGWQTQADARLELEEDGAVAFYNGGPGAVFFESLPDGGSVMEPLDGGILEETSDCLTVRVKGGLVYEFSKFQGGKNVVLVDRIRDLCGNYLQYLRNANGLQQIRESAGRCVEVTSSRGRIYEMQLRHPDYRDRRPLVRFDYNESGDLVAVYDALNHAYRFDYDDHRLTKHTDRNDLSFYYEYDTTTPDWRCIHSWGDGGLYDYHFEYDDLLGETRFTDSLGHAWIIQLDDRGLPIKDTDPLGGETLFGYDEVGRTTVLVDAAGHRSEYEYDERGNVTRLTRPDGLSVVNEYNEQNDLIRATDPRGHDWLQDWDSRRLLCKQVTPVGGATEYSYSERGDLVGMLDPLGNPTRFEVNAYGSTVAIVDALEHVTRYEVDILGNTAAEIGPVGEKTRYFYDAKSRLTRRVTPAGGTISARYDGEDNPTAYSDEAGHVTELKYFGIGEIAQRIHPDGTFVQYDYDTEERLVAVTNERGQTHQLVHDQRGWIVREIDYWGKQRMYDRDAAGNLVESVDPLGRKTKYELDRLCRIVAKKHSDGQEEKFEYDENSNLVATENKDVRIDRTFDAANQLIEEKQGDMWVLSEYDLVGNRLRRASSHGNNIIFQYDRIGNVVEIGINREEPIRIKRDPRGLVVHESLSPQLQRSFEYDRAEKLKSQQLLAEGRTVRDRKYTYDATGNLINQFDSSRGATTFRYDAMGRIIEQISPEGKLQKFFHDPAGDLLQQTGGDDDVRPGKRLGRYDGTTYGFDDAGNLTERTGKEGHVTLEWDCSNRLIAARNGNDSCTNIAYDPQARRVFKETNGVRTTFAWDGNFLLSDQVGEENAREYVYYPDSFEPLALIDADQTVYYYQNDLVGLPHEVCDAVGEIVWAAQYNSRGAVEALPVAKISNPIRLRGQYYDDEIELCYSRYRYFDPSLGSFVSQDPLGLVAGVNSYQYAPNVWVWSDPFGLACNTPGTGVVYLRTNPKTGKQYVGKSKSKEAFKKRKKAHDRKLRKESGDPNAQHDFEILEDGIDGVNDPKALSKAEEDWIRCGDGPGVLENKRFEMADHNYPGDIPKP